MTSEIVAQIAVASYCQLNLSHLIIRSGAVPLAKGTARCVRVPGSRDVVVRNTLSVLLVSIHHPKAYCCAATCCKHFGHSRSPFHSSTMLCAREEVEVPALEVLAYLQGVWRCTAWRAACQETRAAYEQPVTIANMVIRICFLLYSQRSLA